MLDVLSDRQKQTLITWLKDPPDGIDLSELDTVATDLWKHYRDAVAAVYPQVSVVADRFHVVQNLHTAIHKVRKQVQSDATCDEEKSQLKGLRFLLLKNRNNLSSKDTERLEALALNHPTLYQLWQLRQDLHDWYNVHTTPELAKETLLVWLKEARSLNLKALNTFCNTLDNWLTEILNFFQHRVTSGFVEGVNNKIRLLKCITFGLSNHENFRLRVIAFCG